MSDLISKRSVTERLIIAKTLIESVLQDMPTVEPRKGKWIREPNCWYRCSECGDHYPSMRNRMDYGFCPNCGAKMEVEDEGRPY